MSKPVEKTDWATGLTALKLPTDSNRWILGWQTLPDNLPSQVGEKPNLQQQNYWQFAVHEWLNYFSSLVPDTVGGVAVVDLWAWDTARVTDGDVYPWCNAIQESGGKLRWTYSVLNPAVTWLELQPETIYGAKYQELLLILSSGLGIRVVDGAGVIYTIKPNGVDSPDTAMLLGGSLLAPTPMTFDLDASLLDVERNAGGSITNPTDFSGFTSILNTASFDSNNPDGIRVVVVGDLALATITDTGGPSLPILTSLPVKRTWIRPMSTTSTNPAHNTIATGAAILSMDLQVGRKYRCTLQIKFTADAVSSILMRMADGTNLGQTVNSTYRDTGSKSFFTDFEFYHEALQPAIKPNWAGGVILERIDGGSDMNTIYGAGYLASNWVRVEEVL